MIRALKRRQGVAIPLARQRAIGHSTPAPVAGWNARDSIAAMEDNEAIVLDNWFPEETRVRVRRGQVRHTDQRVFLADEDGEIITDEDGDGIVFTHGIEGQVESLMGWTGPASAKLFAAFGGEIAEVTEAGEAEDPDFQGLTGSRWQHVMFGTSAGNFLYIVNGADAPRYYDGTDWTIPSITGLTAANLIHVNVFKRRLFFIEKDTLSFWYFPVETVAGAMTRFRLDPLCRLGGHLVAMGTWTRDGGDGMDDLAVFVTSEGEVIVFQGLDPGDADGWALVGVFRIGAPISRRCFLRWGSDLIVMTEDGFVPLSRALTTDRKESIAISDPISGAVSDAVRKHRTNFGWEPILYPTGNMVLFNVPLVTGIVIHQYVINTTTKAWCRFLGMNANCWALLDNDLYFGGENGVFRADVGDADLGENIDADVKTAFSYFKSRGRLKRLVMARPIMTTIGSASVVMEASVDFEDRRPTASPTFTPSAGAIWDEAVWDVADWGGRPVLTKDWQSVSGFGYAFALRLKTATQGETLWNSTDWLYERGGLL